MHAHIEHRQKYPKLAMYFVGTHFFFNVYDLNPNLLVILLRGGNLWKLIMKPFNKQNISKMEA